MSPTELHKEMEKGKFRPAYYFYGAEDFRIKEAEKAVAAKFLPKTQLKTNHLVLSASKQKIGDLLTELSIIPMLGERQLFTINDIQALKEKQIEQILSLLNPPDPNRTVIMISSAAKTPRKTTKIFKYLTSKTTPVEFPKLRQASAVARIKKNLNAKKITIEPDAVNLLAELTGGDFGALASELNKLSDYVGEGGNVTPEIVGEISSNYQAFKVFELSSYAAKGQLDKALAVIDFLLSRGESATGMTFWLGEHFIGLYLTQNKQNIKGGGRSDEWKYRGQLGRFSNEQLEEIIRLISDADAELRDNLRDHKLVLEELIFNISEPKKT